MLGLSRYGLLIRERVLWLLLVLVLWLRLRLRMLRLKLTSRLLLLLIRLDVTQLTDCMVQMPVRLRRLRR